MKRAPAIAVSMLVWLIGVPLVHAGLPWLLSLVGPRWVGGWSSLSAVPIAAGVALLFWVAVTGLSRLGELGDDVELNWQPKLFLAEGPYHWTRNPMYVGELALWLGFALWFGSPVVLGGAVALFLAMERMIRREEGDLEARFGDEFRRYAATVPRWLVK
jgi:protein-S-isoprenylcysteine O-methyltransferase Ste14